MKVLITGGAGFIGSEMAKFLIRKGIEVRTIDLTKSDVEGCEKLIGSILDTNNVSRAVRGCDHVIHLAAMLGVRRTETKRLECLNINIQGTANILESCIKERVKKIVFTSSSEVYGEQTKIPITEQNPLNPISIYAVTKLAGEEYVKAYCSNYGLDYSIVRFFNVYGTGQVAEFVMPRFIKAVLENKSPVVYGSGNQMRAFCHVKDAVRGAYLSLINENANSEIFNIGNDSEPISMKELAKRVIYLSKKNVPIQFIPMDDSDRDKEREIQKRVPDISRAKNILGYTPKISLDEGILDVMKFKKIEESWFEPMET